MTIDWGVQLVNCAIVVAFALAVVLWHDWTVLRIRRRESIQYRFFAIRDRVIMLVANESFSQDDPQWKETYDFVNECAKATTVDAIRGPKSAFSFTRALMDSTKAPPIDHFGKLPKELKWVWIETVKAMLSACFASRGFRIAFHLSMTVRVIRLMTKRIAPELFRQFAAWKKAADSMNIACHA